MSFATGEIVKCEFCFNAKEYIFNEDPVCGYFVKVDWKSEEIIQQVETLTTNANLC